MLKGIIGTDLAGSSLTHRVNGFPDPTEGTVISIERSGKEILINHTHGPTDIPTMTRHSRYPIEVKRDKETGEISIASTNGTTVIKPSKR